MMPAVSVKSVTRQFGDLVAVDNLSFDVAGGELFGLLGPNGAGKTTVINLITGMLTRDEGEIRVFGHDPQVVLLSATLGGIFNIFALTYKEKLTKITLEFGLAPRPLIWVFLPKVLLALIVALLTGTVFLIILYFWLGYWPGRFLWAVWLLMGLTALFWIGIGLFAGLQANNYMSGAAMAVIVHSCVKLSHSMN